MSLVSGHLGRRVSALLDGQMSPAEADAAWTHVHTCHLCRDEVEREGWIKTRLSTLSFDDGPGGCAPDRLKGALLGVTPADGYLAAGDCDLTNRSRPRRVVGFAALGGGAAGAAVMGVLALGAAPAADIPTPERRQQPVSNVSTSPTHVRAPVRLDR